MYKKTNSKHRHITPRKLNNPEKKSTYDPWGDLCEKYGEKNHWASAKKPPNKKTK